MADPILDPTPTGSMCPDCRRATPGEDGKCGPDELCPTCKAKYHECAACGATQGPSAQDIWSGKWATDFLGQLASIKGLKQKLRALTMPSGHTAECPQCHYMNHQRAASCKYCYAAL